MEALSHFLLVTDESNSGTYQATIPDMSWNMSARQQLLLSIFLRTGVHRLPIACILASVDFVPYFCDAIAECAVNILIYTWARSGGGIVLR
jgi:hypothetical protein